ncbi:MAG: hypothetical protein APF76_02110 [Desulfitibacter sp. BRH_c19]|nr:MAG: hypothetical protein APF76_02110 [Desulfitibacter sp. BRH_c19]
MESKIEVVISILADEIVGGPKLKTAVIVNPVAGRRKSFEKWKEIRQRLIDNQLDFEVFFTSARGMASNLAREIQKAGYSRILVAGGDGTLHEVINGLDLPGDIEIGVLPTGTGNDFARELGITYDKDLALKLMTKGRIRIIDLGEVNQRKFINIAGVGFDAQVAHEVNSGFKFVTGTVAYLFALVKVLLTYKSLPVDIFIENTRQTEEVLFLSVANAPYIGGGMKIVPQAKIDDGFLHICLAKKVSRMDILRTLPKIYKGTHVKHPRVDTLITKEIRISSNSPLVLHADGEIIGTLPAYFKVLPSILHLLVP